MFKGGVRGGLRPCGWGGRTYVHINVLVGDGQRTGVWNLAVPTRIDPLFRRKLGRRHLHRRHDPAIHVDDGRVGAYYSRRLRGLSGGYRILRLSDCLGAVDRNPVCDALGLGKGARADSAGTLLYVYRCGRGDVVRGSRLPGRNASVCAWR